MVKAKAKPKRKAVDETVRFLIQITDWDTDYSFGLAGPRPKWMQDRGTFDEFRHIGLHAKVLSPAQIAGTEVRAGLVPSEGVREATHLEDIGYMSQGRDGLLSVFLMMPEDASPYIAQGLQGGAYRLLELEGTRWLRRNSQIRGFKLLRCASREAYPDVVGEVEGLVEEAHL
jgi:hypothetical protein